MVFASNNKAILTMNSKIFFGPDNVFDIFFEMGVDVARVFNFAGVKRAEALPL